MYSPTYMVMNAKLICYKVQVNLYKRELFIYDGLHCTLLPSSPSSSSSSSSLGASLSLSCSPFSLRFYRVQVIQRNIYQFKIIIVFIIILLLILLLNLKCFHNCDNNWDLPGGSPRDISGGQDLWTIKT